MLKENDKVILSIEEGNEKEKGLGNGAAAEEENGHENDRIDVVKVVENEDGNETKKGLGKGAAAEKENGQENDRIDVVKVVKKKRGRPPKASASIAKKDDDKEASEKDIEKKARGRPKKEKHVITTNENSGKKKGRGRPRKAEAQTEQNEEITNHVSSPVTDVTTAGRLKRKKAPIERLTALPKTLKRKRRRGSQAITNGWKKGGKPLKSKSEKQEPGKGGRKLKNVALVIPETIHVDRVESISSHGRGCSIEVKIGDVFKTINILEVNSPGSADLKVKKLDVRRRSSLNQDSGEEEQFESTSQSSAIVTPVPMH